MDRETIERDIAQCEADLANIRAQYQKRCDEVPLTAKNRKAIVEGIMAECESLKVVLNTVGQLEILRQELEGIERHLANEAAGLN